MYVSTTLLYVYTDEYMYVCMYVCGHRYVGNSPQSRPYWSMLTAFYQFDSTGKKSMPQGGPTLLFGGRFTYKVHIESTY